MRALRNRISKHAKQSDRRELLGQQCKQRQQLREQALHAQCFVRLFDLRLDVLNRQVCVDLSHDVTHAGNHRRWIARSAHFEDRAGQRALLSIRGVDSGRNVVALARVLRIFADADDLDLVWFGCVVGEAFSDRVFVRERTYSRMFD